MPPLSQTFAVRHIESGVNGRLTAPAFLDLFQEIAGNDADRLGFSLDALAQRRLTWMLLRLFVRFDAPLPRLGDALTLTTWPSGHNGLSAWRDAVAVDTDGQTLARVTTQWVIVDLDRRRPTRLPDDLYGFERPDLGRLDLADTPPTAPETATDAAQVFVRRSDLDANRHANNARYVEWALEPLANGFLDAHRLATLDVLWKAEAFRGDRLDAIAGPDASGEPLAFAHAVAHADGRTSALVRTRWHTV